MKNEYNLNKVKLQNSNLHNPILLDCESVAKAIDKIADGTTSGHDSICIEHFKLAHPCVPFIFTFILNIFISIGELPRDFGLGIVSPIPKFKGNKRSVSADDFRSITLNVIPSKIFEHCALPFLHNLSSSHRQFGFKKGLSCLNAISIVRKIIQFFNKRGGTISMALVDVKKAFDKANIWGILLLLQNKAINPDLITVLEHWFTTSSARAKWNNVLSEPVSLLSGVRQGGILSPLLFSAYIDVVLDDLEKTSCGCFINKLV